MKIIIAKDDGTIVDTYPDVALSDDSTLTLWRVINWIERTLQSARAAA